ncbi:MAG: DUF2934 domain-containing protein [Verrucomicrobiota bacterium]|nr:DUF2934 domain-containing protein [Verrucomicrobiota bacterium]
MPKKTKTESTNEMPVTAPDVAVSPGTQPALAAKKSVAKKSAKKATGRKIAPKKSGAKKTTPQSSGAGVAAVAKPAKESGEPSDEEIRLRAYFIAEHRARRSQHGDPSHDWIEARKELLAERHRAGNGQHKAE